MRARRPRAGSPPGSPDGIFLNLRAGPGTEFKVKAKLLPGDDLKIDAVRTNDDWKHVNVPRLSSEYSVYGGWLHGKCISEYPCKNETKAEYPKWLGVGQPPRPP